jgi:hypothetical protein
MRIRTTLALAAATLTLGVPVAAADPDGYQPQLRSDAQPDAIDRYLANNGPDGSQPQLRADAGPDAVDRYVANARRSTAPKGAVEAGGIDWQIGALGALGGGLVILLLVAGTAMVRQRRRLVLH